MSDNCSGCEGQYAVLKGRTQSTWPRLLCIFAEDPNDCIAIFFVRSVPNPDSEVQSQGSGGRLEQAPGEQARAVAERKPGHLGHPLFQVVAERPARHARQQQRPPAVPLLVAKPLQVRRQHLRPIIRLFATAQPPGNNRWPPTAWTDRQRVDPWIKHAPNIGLRTRVRSSPAQRGSGRQPTRRCASLPTRSAVCRRVRGVRRKRGGGGTRSLRGGRGPRGRRRCPRPGPS